MEQRVKIRIPGGEKFSQLKTALKENQLSTVCKEAMCPNMDECWGGGTATIMLMGDTCTRGCRFCSVTSGKPPGLDPYEPEKVSKTLKNWNLKYVVLTSVCRDDLPDGGASHFAKVITQIKEDNPSMLIESLIPDFRNDTKSLKTIIKSGVDVIAHNIETVKSLTPIVRDSRATYNQSINVLENLKKYGAKYTKSSIMVGVGESKDEVISTMSDLRSVNVDFLTIGQYLRPTKKQLSVKESVSRETFRLYEKTSKEMGFKYVASGPLVRSSYRAGELFLESIVKEGM